MNRLALSTTKFLKKNASLFLSVVASGGVVATAVCAAKEAPSVTLYLKQKEEEKGEKLLWYEKARYAAPKYKRTIGVAAGTIGMIFGAHVIDAKKQAAILSSYKLLEETYHGYRKKVREDFGDDADKYIMREMAKDDWTEERLQDIMAEMERKGMYIKASDIPDEEKILFGFDDGYSHVWFESTKARVIAAEMEVNRELAVNGNPVFINDMREMLGIPTCDYGYDIGWSTYELLNTYEQSWVDFEHLLVNLEDGLQAYIIYCPMPATFDFAAY